MGKFAVVSAIIAVLCIHAWTSAAPATYTLQPTVAAGTYHDAFLATDANGGSGKNIGFIGNYGGATTWRYAVQFNGVTVQPGHYVTSATLTMRLYYAATNRVESAMSPAPTINVHRMTESWTRGSTGATWASRGDLDSDGTRELEENWSTAGGTFDPSIVASITPPTGARNTEGGPFDNTDFTWDVTSLVNSWVTGAQPNNGMLLKWSDQNLQKIWYFYGPNNAVITRVPKLVYTTAVPEPSMAIAAGLGAAALLAGRRRRGRAG